MADDPWVGAVLAKRYRIESPYYRTSKAELYRGLDINNQTPVVVHLANVDSSQNSQFTSQFEQDARRLRTLEHPAIIPVLEYGRERDRLFMVCPFLAGGSLEQQVHRQWSVERTNEVVERIGEALAYLHGQELVHLNVSADSILFDEESRPHLSLGFGRINRAIDPAAGRGNAYVLPEQARLSYVLADPKVDVYAFGVVLWLMLLGQPPYADAPLDKQLAESWQQTELPDAWRTVLERAISSNPERRFNSMPEFLAAWRESQDQAHPSYRQRTQQKGQEGRNAAAQYLYGAPTQTDGPDAAADAPSYPVDSPVQQTRYGNMEQSARPQAQTTMPQPFQEVSQTSPGPLFPDIQANFQLPTSLPHELWPGQTLTFAVVAKNRSEVDWATPDSPYEWQVNCALFGDNIASNSHDERLLKEPLRPQEERRFHFRLSAPDTPGTYPLEVRLFVTRKEDAISLSFADTTLQNLAVLNLEQLDLDTLLAPPQPLPVSTERRRLRYIGTQLEDSSILPARREELVHAPLLATWLDSGSVREQVTATKALQRLGPLPVTSGTVNDLVEQYLVENAAATITANRLLTVRDASQEMKAWLQARLEARQQLPVTNLQSPVSNPQTPKPPAANSQPPAAPLPPFILTLEQIAHSKPLIHKIVFDITPQRVKLIYGGENYEGPTQLDDTVLRTLALKRREYGMALFNAILHETDRQNQRLTATRNGYDFALREAREGLYLELQLDDSLHELCWENLCDPDGLPVGISDKRALYRRVRANVSKTRVDYGKLRILVMICNPPNLGPGSETPAPKPDPH